MKITIKFDKGISKVNQDVIAKELEMINPIVDVRTVRVLKDIGFKAWRKKNDFYFPHIIIDKAEYIIFTDWVCGENEFVYRFEAIA